MKARAKKWISISLAAMMAASLLGGCGKEEASPNTGGGGGDKESKPITLSMMTSSHTSFPYKEDWPIYKFYKEKTNIGFKVQPVMDDYATVMNLAISSGEMPDLMLVTDLRAANTYGSSGAFVNFFDHLDIMPNYKKFLDENPDAKASILSPEGKNYILPLSGLEQQSRRSWLYRADIFKKHNLTPPTTYEELYTVSKKLKEIYPDSYPIAAFNNLSTLEKMAPGLNTRNTYYYDYEKNEWRYGPTEENYKTLVTYMNKFYKEGLVAPDFMALKRKQFNDALLQDKSFISIDYIGLIDEIPQMLGDQAGDFSLEFMAPPVGSPDGKPENIFSGLLGDGFAVSEKSKEKEALLKYIDFLYSPEGIEIATWGKEGETYTVENGAKKFKAEYEGFGDLRKKTGIATYGSYFVLDMKAYDPMNSEKMQSAMDQIGKHETKAQPRLPFTNEENEVISLVGESVKKYMEESISKFILGQKSMDEWDAYVAEVNKLGVDKVLDVYRTAYERNQKFVEQK
ncbi:extracellular solute-binding protein [Paenibacillus dakarensis]|uniref:extracellular solute-binding protein n=1 Tax=Paenibacillus dakarensis TaxID=1527293 RepID=UPI0006D53F2B|nr:extracellular solute-binding protein [Paenibacillus dakarensis]